MASLSAVYEYRKTAFTRSAFNALQIPNKEKKMSFLKTSVITSTTTSDRVVIDSDGGQTHYGMKTIKTEHIVMAPADGVHASHLMRLAMGFASHAPQELALLPPEMESPSRTPANTARVHHDGGDKKKATGQAAGQHIGYANSARKSDGKQDKACGNKECQALVGADLAALHQFGNTGLCVGAALRLFEQAAGDGTCQCGQHHHKGENSHGARNPRKHCTKDGASHKYGTIDNPLCKCAQTLSDSYHNRKKALFMLAATANKSLPAIVVAEHSVGTLTSTPPSPSTSVRAAANPLPNLATAEALRAAASNAAAASAAAVTNAANAAANSERKGTAAGVAGSAVATATVMATGSGRAATKKGQAAARLTAAAPAAAADDVDGGKPPVTEH